MLTQETCLVTINRSDLLSSTWAEETPLDFGYWSFFGIWSLGFGAFYRRLRKAASERCSAQGNNNHLLCKVLPAPPNLKPSRVGIHFGRKVSFRPTAH